LDLYNFQTSELKDLFLFNFPVYIYWFAVNELNNQKIILRPLFRILIQSKSQALKAFRMKKEGAFLLSKSNKTEIWSLGNKLRGF
jgi:hypothetical protein